MSVGGYIRIYLAVYGPEIIGCFSLEEKSQKIKVVCGLGRTYYGGLRNVQPHIIDPQHNDPGQGLNLDLSIQSPAC